MNKIQRFTQELRDLADAEMIDDCLDEYLGLIDAESDRAVAFWEDGVVPHSEPVLVQFDDGVDSDDIYQATIYQDWGLEILHPTPSEKNVRRWARINKVDK